jgi:hypothetical protein
MEIEQRVSRYLIIFGCLALAALVLRFHLVPWDPGGCLLQVCISVVVFVAFGTLLPQLKPVPERLAGAIIFPLGVLFVFGTLVFAPQPLIPFMFVGFAAAAALLLWSRSRVVSAALFVALIFLPLSAWCWYGARRMVFMTEFRRLDAGQVRAVQFVRETETGETIQIEDPALIGRIVESLADTSPYSPNHERVALPWQCRIAMADGETLDFRVGLGNRCHRKTVWIEFGVEVYQNPELYRVLRDQDVNLWNPRGDLSD